MKSIFRICIFGLFLSLSSQLYSQGRAAKEIKRQEDEARAKFPTVIDFEFKQNTLGFYLQQEYQAQANSACQIIRMGPEKRLYIPKDLVDGYQLANLQNTSVVELKISASNFLFMALTPSDTFKINHGNYTDDQIRAKRVIGLDDPLVSYGDALPSTIRGFPSVYYQKSCASYFEGNVEADLRLPMAEVKASLSAEAKNSSLITSITGRFFSPLSLLLKDNSIPSVYAHMQIWEKYSDDFTNPLDNTTIEKLITHGYYVDEMQATLVNRSKDKELNSSMNGKVAAGIQGGAFSVNGDVKSGYENQSKFALANFTTLIHRGPGRIIYEVKKLPTPAEISTKLNSSTTFPGSPQPSFKGFANSITQFEITRVLAGIPSSLCAWEIENADWDANIWATKPKVSSSATRIKDYPECVCKISGFIKPTAITGAGAGGTIDINLKLTNLKKVGTRTLKLEVTEPKISVTKGPVLAGLDDATANAKFSEVTTGSQRFSQFEFTTMIDDSQMEVKVPVENTPGELVFINDSQSNLLSLDQLTFNGKVATVKLKSSGVPNTWVKTGEISVPVKIKTKVQVPGITKTYTELISNTINLRMPQYQQALLNVASPN